MHRSFSTVLTTLAHTIQNTHTHTHPYTTAVLTYSSRNSVWVGCVCSASGKRQMAEIKWHKAIVKQLMCERI